MVDLDLTQRQEALLSRVPSGCFIGGGWQPASAGETFEVTDPSTGDLLAVVADAGPADALAALTAAAEAQRSWASTAPRARADLLRRAYDRLLERADDFALLITLEMGKPLSESRGEVLYAAEFLRWFSEQTERIGGEYRISADGSTRLVTTRQPVGPSLLITPWNFPLAMVTRKLAPALAAGCTAVIKPAEDTPLACLAFADLLRDVGLPAGIVHVLPTSRPEPLVNALMNDDRLRKVSFTGSTPVGRQLLRAAAGNVLRTSMELGGNAPFIVFDDADVDAAVEGAMVAKMRNGGESCVAANRFLVHESVASDFAGRLAQRMSSLKMGRGTDPDTQLGPIINARQRERLAALVDSAVADGATVACGGRKGDGAGYFYEPTVLLDLPADARISADEVFGPVAPITTFRTEDEALALANASQFGLVAFVYTRDVGRALRVSDGLETGMVGVNRGLVSNAAAPFGGVKQSGLGREGGLEGIDEYLSVKYLAVDVA